MSNTKNTEEPQGSQDAQESQETRDSQQSSKPTKNNRTTRRPSPIELLRQARGQLAELTGMEAESVSSFEQTEEGWSLEVEVLELERVPDTMSLMASYHVELDPEGLLTGYRRVRRYERGRADAHRSGGR
ncbi:MULTISPECIES: gas vesicle protein [unclassified Streptomyces]|uniref:gas vesicle protein GvpO n=1 Tax=unclassified Streptomyces TaxID=2593676 RepID=UPI000F6BFEFC|nr:MULTISPECIES: gas vesicle protein [unclassified Streptomyces]AZM64393.1 gas vesicle protein [Streptomyces sp. WAC 01438]RSM89153.1 gas vesicle protein [Streptomyces sp. WAC 01420]